MELLPREIETYAAAHTEAESEVLSALNRETHAKILKPRMLSGQVQGRLLALLSRLVHPRRILEIGTFTGYSALCLSEGLAEDGKIITLEANEELEGFARTYFEKAGKSHLIDLRIGKAAELIPELDEVFDLVFIDADKASYGLYFDLIIGKVRPGGLIIADNVLWSGKVVAFREGQTPDKDTKALLDFNQKVHSDARVRNLLLPVRDGIMLLQKL